jgi:undecaprenyl-diphosphatase
VEALWELDQTLFRLIHVSGHRDWLDPVFFVISSSGLGWMQALAIFMIFGYQTARTEARSGLKWLSYLLAGWALASLVNTGILKRLIERERPSRWPFAEPHETFYYNSFPSGHTASSFGIATVALFLTWGTRKSWIGWTALVWAAMVGLSRIYRGVHWPSDVLGGACVGLAAGCIVALWAVREPRKDAHQTAAEAES